MMWSRRAAGVATLAAAGWALAASSALPLRWHRADTAMLRLSWVARPERIEECRELDEAELAQRPAHMRQATECVGQAATYRLRVAVDGDAAAERVLVGGGLRSDRAIFALEEFALSPGRRHLVVEFARVEPAAAPMDSANLRRGAVPRRLVLDTTVTVPAASVALVTMVDGRLRLRLP
jgi:hypothetical protein